MKKILLVAFISIVSSLATIIIYQQFFFEPQQIIVKEESPARYTNFLTESQLPKQLFYSSAPTNFIEAAAAVTPAVVYIKSVQKNRSSLDDFWRMGQGGTSSGSGVIISGDGYIVTNHHVIENASELEVSLNDKRTYEAEIIGSDPSTDLALIKIDMDDLPYLGLANSDSVRTGEWVLAVGNPFNLTSTVTAGIVSAKGRNINILEGSYKIESFIQTDAAVNPGNSGGALVNTNGQLVGINTAIITQSGRYEGYSFAIPANLVRKVIADLKDFGIVQRGFLGVVIEDIDEEIADKLNLKSLEGVHISDINKGSAAADAGLKADDVITHINNVKVKSMPSLQEQVARYRPGDKIAVSYIRNGKKKSTKLVLKNKDNGTTFTDKTDIKVLNGLGLDLRELTKEELTALKVKGVKVVSIRKGSKIDRTNMDPGFVITKINDEIITDIPSIIKAIENAKNKVMLEGVYEDYPGEYYYAFAK
ncbi:MAG: trypsin-like peptidase domain-containing protein [Saprospiraceae bacterium]|mgnify:FL=1